MPKFSIIVPHYQGSISHEDFMRGIFSLAEQSYDDFEVLVYHDGPMLEPSQLKNFEVFESEERYNDFGHSLRDRGIKEAEGEYIIHFNPDNVLFPEALETLASFAEDNNPDIMVFPIKMMGLKEFQMEGERAVYYDKPRNLKEFIVFDGNPIKYGNIDCMQFVMKRDLWLKEGGWSDKREQSDAFMYTKFASKIPVHFIESDPLGEHY